MKTNKSFFSSYLGGPYVEPRAYQIFRAIRPHHRADKCITRGQNNHRFFIYGPECEKIAYLAIRGPERPVNNQTAHRASQLSVHIYQFRCKIWKQSDKDYRENDEVSADAAADAV